MQFSKPNFLTLSTLFLLLAMSAASAQKRPSRESEEKPEEPRDFASRLWYGGGVNIGFSSGFGGGSVFVFGVSPMVGYKIAGQLSAGPRVAFDYTSYKVPGSRATGLTSFDVGAFARYRVFRGLFFQGEVSNEWYEDLAFYQDLITGAIFQEKRKTQRVNQRLGAGWNFGEPGGAGSEISILYNFAVANDIETSRNPVEYRFGFTWKF